MTDHKRRPLWPLLAAALIGLPMLYVLSFGPAYGLASRDVLPCKSSIERLYRPLNSIASSSEGPVRWWAKVFACRQTNQFWAETQNVWFDAGLDAPLQHGLFDQ